MRLILVRHGQSEGNASGVLQGRLDFGLTALGQRQAELTAERVASLAPARVIASPLKRAAMTAEAIAGVLSLPIEYDERLAEYDVGEASGLTGAQIRERFPAVVAAWQAGHHPRFPGEEGREVFHARVAAFLDDCAGTEGTLVAVAHGGVIGAVCSRVLGIGPLRRGIFDASNCAITEVAHDRTGRLVLHRQNDICHLEGLATRFDIG